EEPIRIKYELADGASTFDKYAVVVGDNAKVTLIMDVQSAADAAGYAAFQTRVKVGKGAEVSLVQIHRCATGYHIIDDFGADVDETGSFQAIQIAFTGKENDLGGHVELNGDRAKCFIRSGYLTADDHVMDINYYVNHTGRECETDIYTSGVLRDKCLKVFRTTIDFQPGAVKSQGEENENVLLMNNGVTNKTVPTILCGEEDVSGEHGCTVGRLADDLIFYLESRGIPNEEIYEMMAKARLEATIRQIPDEKTVEELVEFNNNL
ncbi:MAG: SufD family Fe-S cluster assembly protein, partial [Clostridia bacterium]|nr:SufD family Fe-S cluster assembly protein [Clostridia bacterium]